MTINSFVPSYIGQQLNIDCGYILADKERSNKYPYFLVAVDAFSLYGFIRPLRMISARIVAKELITNVFPYTGCCTTIYSDRGPEMNNKIMKDICTVLGIKHKMSPVQRPRANSRAELQVKIFKKIIKKHAKNHETDWHEDTGLIQLTLNASTRSKLHVSPNYIFMGRRLQLPIEASFGVQYTEGYMTDKAYNSNLYYRQRDLTRMIQKYHAVSLESSRNYYNQSVSRNQEPYEQGDKCYVQREIPAGTKFRALQDKFKGPYEVIRKIERGVYLLKDPVTENQIVSHWDRMRKYGNRRVTIQDGHLVTQEKQSDNELEVEQNSDKTDEEDKTESDTDSDRPRRSTRARQTPNRLTYDKNNKQITGDEHNKSKET